MNWIGMSGMIDRVGPVYTQHGHARAPLEVRIARRGRESPGECEVGVVLGEKQCAKVI